MSIGQRVWAERELRLLCSDWCYWVSNKEESEMIFNRTWNAIKIKASSLGCKTDRFHKSNENIIDDANDYVNGLLLSDASIKKEGRFTQCSSELEWLQKIQRDLSLFDIYSTISDGHYQVAYLNGKLIKSFSYNLWTKCYEEFKELRNKWYPESRKIVPDDIELTPECAGNWYLGDGYINTQIKSSGTYYVILIATCGFEFEYIELLRDKLNKTLGIESYITSSGYVGISRKKAVIKFLDYIRDCCDVDCYKYKFPDIAI